MKTSSDPHLQTTSWFVARCLIRNWGEDSDLMIIKFPEYFIWEHTKDGLNNGYKEEVVAKLMENFP